MADCVKPSILVQLADALEEKLLKKLKSKKVSAADMQVVRQYLKDNGFVSHHLIQPKPGKIHELKEELDRQTQYPFPQGG